MSFLEYKHPKVVVQRFSKENKLDVYTYVKELVYEILRAIKCEICQTDQQGRGPREDSYCSSSPEVVWSRSPSVGAYIQISAYLEGHQSIGLGSTLMTSF